MSLKKNVAANYLGAAVSVLVPILALPWYLSLLGTKYWGLASFVWVLQAILGLVNAGLAQALIREISRISAHETDDRKKVAALLFGFERIYWGFAISTGILVACFADAVASGWLKLENIPSETGRQVILAAAFIFVVQFPVSIYRTVLFGSGLQVSQNMVVAVFTIIRHLGGVIVLYLHRSIATYLIWNALLALFETLVTAKFSWNSVQTRRSELAWDRTAMHGVLALTTKLSFGVLLGMLTLQIDKIFLSWSLPVEQLGYYAIATSVSFGLLQAFTPVTNAALPRVVQLQGQTVQLRRLNLRLFLIMAAIVVVVGVLFWLVGKTLLMFWLRDSQVVAIVFPVLSLLLIGTGLNAVYSVGYINWVAAGAAHKILLVNSLALILSVALLPILIDRYQLLGAAFGWLTINCIGLLFSLDWIHAERGPAKFTN